VRAEDVDDSGFTSLTDALLLIADLRVNGPAPCASGASAGQTLWLLADHLGAIRDIVNDAGALLNRIAYVSFGNVLSQTDPLIATRYLFTGREFDPETGLYYYRARYHDANIGRFTSEDPIGFAGVDSHRISRR